MDSALVLLPQLFSHVALFDGKFIWGMLKKSSTKAGGDVHTRLMKKNYKEVPQWWFVSVLFLSFVLALYACEGFGKQLQLPWWGLLLACAVAFTFTLPIGVIQATTNQQIGLNVITELIIACSDRGFPNCLFWDHVVASVFVDNICVPEKLPTGSPWTCPGDHLFYSASIIWGIIGPGRMFTSKGVYPGLNWFFLIGFLAPVPAWFLARKFPEKKWIKQIHVPLIFSAASAMPNAKAVNYWSWVIVGVFSTTIFSGGTRVGGEA
ncbi:Oligopeptide transporter 5 [Raphanus sativus]|nr:Oligopeptide transporter 5 [Raphanus sativus]